MAWCEASLDIPRSLLEHGADVDAHGYKHGTRRTLETLNLYSYCSSMEQMPVCGTTKAKHHSTTY